MQTQIDQPGTRASTGAEGRSGLEQDSSVPSAQGGYEMWSSQRGQPSPSIPTPATGSSVINVGSGERLVSLVAGAAMLVYGLRRSRVLGLTLAAAGGALLFRGVTGYCAVNAALGRNTAGAVAAPIEIDRTVTIAKPRQEIFAFWRRLENLPKFMSHLKEVRQLSPERSHWVVRMPNHMGTLSWDAEILYEQENERLAWQSVPNALVDNAGEVIFTDSASGRGTDVHVRIGYRPPVGVAGIAIARALNPLFGRMIEEDIRRLKDVFETDVLARSEAGSPAASATTGTDRTRTMQSLGTAGSSLDTDEAKSLV